MQHDTNTGVDEITIAVGNLILGVEDNNITELEQFNNEDKDNTKT